MSTFSISLTRTEAAIRNISMMDAIYNVLQSELEEQRESGFDETKIEGMKGFIKVIQSIMGHADFETVMDIYAEVNNTKKLGSNSKLSTQIGCILGKSLARTDREYDKMCTIRQIQGL